MPDANADSAAAEHDVNGPYRTKPEDTAQMPGGIPYIIGNEAAERFSFYGMKAILTVYMTKYLVDSAGRPDHFSPEQAKEAVGWFGAAVYATPILGALLADTVLGKYRTIMALSLLYCLGHGVLAMIDLQMGGIEPRWILFAGLALISLGAGGIKPCVSSHVGDQFSHRNQHLMTRVYGWFYFSINFGSTFAQILIPLLLAWYGAAVAFGLPGVLMGVATLVFWLGRRQYAHIPPAGMRFWQETFSPDGLRALKNLSPLLLFAAPFWALFDQTASAWVIQAESMDRFFLEVGGWRLEPTPEQLQAVNPILVMLLVPLMSYAVYPWLEQFIKVTPLRKIGAGLVFAALSFAVVAVAESKITAGETPHAWWQVLAYLILTVGEVLLSITLLEFFYTQAPKSMKSVILAVYMLSVSLGNVITAVVNRVIRADDGAVLLPGASYYWFFVGLIAVTAVLYTIWSRFYRGQTYIQGDGQPTGEQPAAEPG
ncbi:MAG: POT family MFS transporter [Planctomycetota bacterium]